MQSLKADPQGRVLLGQSFSRPEFQQARVSIGRDPEHHRAVHHFSFWFWSKNRSESVWKEIIWWGFRGVEEKAPMGS
jgi:hypothetical protein